MNNAVEEDGDGREDEREIFTFAAELTRILVLFT